MALLPLAGWAVDLTGNPGVVVAVADIEYGQATHAATDIRVTLDGGEISNTYWDIEGYYTTNDGTGEAITLATLPVGTTPRYVKIQFKGAYSGYAYGSFAVSPAEIKVTVKNAAYFTKNYKAVDPAAIVPGDVTATRSGVDIDAADIGDYLNIDATKLKYKYTGENVGEYPLTFEGITLVDATNYTLAWADQKMKINAAPLTVGGLFAYTNNYTAAYTYSAEEQKPTVTVKWNHDDNPATDPITLKEGTDFTVAYKVGGEVVASPTNADNYEAYVTGKGNYSTEVDVNALDFAINKAALTVMTIAQTKVYDGAEFDATTAKFSIAGRKGADASKTVTGLEAVIAASDAAAAKYDVTVNAPATAKIGDVALNKNYNVDGTTVVKWEITKRPVTITVGNAEMNVGAGAFPTVPAMTVELKGEANPNTGAISAAEQTAIADQYTVTLQNTGTKQYATALATAAGAAVGTYKNAYLAELTGVAPANYEVKGLTTGGSLTVKGADFNIMPVVESDIQYGTSYTIDYYTTGQVNKDKLVFVIGTKEYTYAEAKAGTGLPTAINNYTVTIKPASIEPTGTSVGATGTPLPGAFNIVPKKLTLTVKNQTVHKNDPITILNELVAGHEGADGITITEALAPGETIADLGLTYSIDDAIVTIAGGKITAAAGDYANAIKVALGNENYELVGGAYTKGTLTVSENFTADLAAATAAATIAEAAANGSKYDVTISGRTLTGGKFNVMVLPFAVKTFDFCEAIGGYAIFNRLISVDGDDVKFALELDEIPANEPFIVKPLADVNFDHMNDHGTPGDKTDDFKDIVFEDVTFVAPAADPVVYKGVTGAEFIGTYTAAIDLPADSYAMQGGSFKHFDAAKAGAVKFTKAYIKLANGSASARFFVEEPGENGATAIKALNVDTMESVAMDGWYTINGIKLNAKPTQKGIYLFNGKKVAIR